MRSAIKDAGYSQNVANSPQRITDRKWFRENLPDYQETSSAIRDLLGAAHLDHYVFPLSMTDEEIIEVIESIRGCKVKKIKHGETQTWAYFWVPDNKGRKDAIDIVLKVRGDYAAEKIAITDPIDSLSDEEVDAEIAALEREKQERGLKNDGQ